MTDAIAGPPADALRDYAAQRDFSFRRIYRAHFAQSPRRERMFISSLAFFGGFGAARTITHMIRRGVGPFGNMQVGGRHLHHMVFGIGGLLGIGYLWLLLVGTDHLSDGARSRATAAAFGLSSALTLDEFALWLNLQDVYWAKQGRASVDAVAAFGGLLSIGLWGAPFLSSLGRELAKLKP
ncbi:MAG: hypothetical protein WAM30_18570 [Candidatus Dormiibacterota bacterium]